LKIILAEASITDAKFKHISNQTFIDLRIEGVVLFEEDRNTAINKILNHMLEKRGDKTITVHVEGNAMVIKYDEN